MTNTRITDPEILERNYPVILKKFEIRRGIRYKVMYIGSGGKGKFFGGCGVCRRIEFLEPLTISILSERRAFSPYGLKGGNNGQRGFNLWIRKNNDNNTEEIVSLGGKNTFTSCVGDEIEINTPGGGGYGKPQND